MYKVLIVDDEKIGRKGLTLLLERMEEDFFIIEAENGKEALFILNSQTIDILLTDIRMPFMDGIELIQQSKMLQPHMKSVICSGYEDFNYAKTAIKLGVEDYILKPINPREFEILIHKLMNTSNDESLVVDYILNGLINGNHKEVIMKNLKHKHFNHYLKDYKRLILLSFPQDFFGNDEMFPTKLKKEIVTNYDYLNLNLNESLLFFTEDNISRLKGIANTIYNYIQIHYNTKAYIAISRSLELNDIKDSLNHLEDLLEGMYYHPDKHLYFEDEKIEETQIEDIDTLKSQIYQHLSIRDIDLLRKDFNNFYNLYKNQNDFYKDIMKYKFSDIIDEVILLLDTEDQQIDERVVRFYRANDETSMRKILDRFLEDIEKVFLKERKDNRQEILIVKKYIHSHYGIELSTELLAQQVNLTSSYLSHLFKQETGENLGKYIKRVRMEKARYMLVHTNKRINSISNEIGYTNVSYFCQTFRNYYGLTPQKYRNNGHSHE